MYKFSANLGLLWNEFSQIDAIYKSKEYGFDAVELHCGHGYLLSQFLSNNFFLAFE